ncbi:anti-sigma factor family protein [Leclercia tamurae]|uniref:Anti-sigma factor n=1 Tax=Leclercia tamurae TaxID=2926467 RepID=A0ABT2R6W0_9ENTR|nr:hypothetical protein [Leclercia tamurae]
MKTIRFTPPYGDEAIVAWLDGEMAESDAEQFARLLRSDDLLAGRTAELMKSNQDYHAAFSALLEEAPGARMQARLAAHLSEQAPPRAGVSRRALIAASVCFLLTGTGVGYLARTLSGEGQDERDENANIRDLEAHYMSLYSTETLLDADSSPPVLRRGLARIAQDVGLHLREQQLVLHNSELKMVRILRYEHTAIAQIAWHQADYGPLALCISPLGQGGATALSSEQRYGMHIAWWHARGYQFALIGRTPVAQLQQAARQLQAALS